MKLSPDDPRLTAYLLGELSSGESASIAHALATDPELQRALQELKAVQQRLSEAIAKQPPMRLLPRQRENVIRAARLADNPGQIAPVAKVKKKLPFLIRLAPLFATAAAVVAGIFILKHPGDEGPQVQASSGASSQAAPVKVTPAPQNPSDGLAVEPALLPAPGPPVLSTRPMPSVQLRPSTPANTANLTRAFTAQAAAMKEHKDFYPVRAAERLAQLPVPEGKDFPPLVPRAFVSAMESPTLALPVQSGRASLDWVEHSIRDERRHPPADAVRVEEILNRFSLRPAGAAAVSQGVTLSAESIACPWKPSATLLLTSFRGAADGPREIVATFKANTMNVHRYCLLGYSPVVGQGTGPLPTYLPAQTITSLVLEIEPAGANTDLGQIEWSVNGQAAPAVALSRNRAGDPSDEVRFAALVCAYAQWLVDGTANPVDAGMLAALARENRSDRLPEERKDFIRLVDQSLGCR